MPVTLPQIQSCEFCVIRNVAMHLVDTLPIHNSFRQLLPHKRPIMSMAVKVVVSVPMYSLQIGGLFPRGRVGWKVNHS